ncbi:MAG: O-antigen polymerase [Caulobacteraceae bacterium]|jgi:hypothetical protein|nr:O-antigen polymerase [Caulobacteraceae bacterium]
MSIGSHPAQPTTVELERTFAGYAKAARPVGLPAFPVLAIHLLVFGSLFSGLPGPAALGELRGEGTVIGAVAVILSAVLSGAIVDLRGIRSALVFLPLAACIALSYAFNAEGIANAHFLGREGGEKFFTSLLVVIFYFSVFFTVSCIARVYGARAVLLCGSNAALWCGFLMIAEMAIEIVSWFVPPLREIWRVTRGLWVSSGSSEPRFRLVGFAPEPSLGAITAMGLIGLLAAEVVLRGGTREWSRARARAVGFLIFALVALELVLANARTFAIGAFGAVLAALLVSRFASAIPAALKSAVIVLATLPVQAGMIWVTLQQEPGARSISNISRSVGMVTASQLGAQHPLFGLGLGQYGFHFRSVVPSWGLASFEISRYFREDQYHLLAGLPPTFSMFSRVASELGLIGLAAWLFPPLFAIRQAIIQRPGPLTSVMICALAAQIWSGLSFDSFRNVYYWFWLALLLAWPKQKEGVTRLMSSGFAANGVRGVG